MAFPFITEANFEDGTRGHFDSTNDTGSHLDFPHYSDLAKAPGLPGPFSGAHCMRIDLSTSTDDAFIQENTSWDLAASASIEIKFQFFVSSDITMANADEFEILGLHSAGATEAGTFINFTTANGLRLGIGLNTASSFLPLPTGRWVTVEMAATIDSGGGNDGTIDLRLDGGSATQVTGLNQAAVTFGRIGTTGQDAGTTAGVLLFDDVISDDGRIFPPTFRYPTSRLHTISGHAFVGSGRIENLSLLSGGATDNVLSVFDTDVGNTSDANKVVAELKNTANQQIVNHPTGDIQVHRGCFVSMSGTNPRALVKIKYAPAYGSDGAIRTAGAAWKPTPGNV